MGTPRKISDLGHLSVAEYQVLRELDTGKPIIIGKGDVPASGDLARRVRAALIRIIALGYDPKHIRGEKGVEIGGAYVDGVLDLEGCRIPSSIMLTNCRFAHAPVLRSAVIDGVVLSGSVFPGLVADGLEARACMTLQGATITGPLMVSGAKLTEDLDCGEAVFQPVKIAAEKPVSAAPVDPLAGLAILGDRLETGGGVFLRHAEIVGEVHLSGAEIGGDLDCVSSDFRSVAGTDRSSATAMRAEGLKTGGNVFFRDTRFEGAVFLASADVGRNLDCRIDAWDCAIRRNWVDWTMDLDLRGAVIGNVLFLREISTSGGRLVLSGARIGSIEDRTEALASPAKVWLNYCVYEGLVGTSVDVPVEERLAFLAKQFRLGDPADFYPQPYEQLAAVLGKAGHGEDARAVLIEKERRQRAARRAREGFAGKIWFGFWDRLLGVTVRYGRQPLWAFYWLLCFWLVGVGVFGVAEARGALKPNKEVVLRSEEWIGCAAEGEAAQAECYLLTDRGASYPRFNRWIYSADTLLPIVSLEMQEYWIPDDRKEWPGWGARGYLWFHIAVGWALSLLAVAGFSGLVKSD